MSTSFSLFDSTFNPKPQTLNPKRSGVLPATSLGEVSYLGYRLFGVQLGFRVQGVRRFSCRLILFRPSGVRDTDVRSMFLAFFKRPESCKAYVAWRRGYVATTDVLVFRSMAEFCALVFMKHIKMT